MGLIVNLIKKKGLNFEQREKINYILYNAYEKWAIKKAYDFKNLHKYKCKNINTQELVLYSKFGLFKSIKNYNGNSSFLFYSEFYVRRELLNVITNHFSLSIIPKSVRIKSKQNLSDYEYSQYKNKLEPMLINYVNNDAFDKSHNSKQEDILDKIHSYETNMQIWESINKLDSFSKRIIYLKYDKDFNKIRSNKIIGELMCCSEENIRKNLQETLKLGLF
jgi:RNA polymerase sigma factor (sigma-70 family)